LNGIFDDPATTVNEAADNQIEAGTWTVQVADPATPSPNSGAQNYAIVVVGGVCSNSSARIDKVLPNNQLAGTSLTCNDTAVVTIDDLGNANDSSATLTTTEIASRTKIEVLDASNNVVDTECGIGNLTCTNAQRSLQPTDFTIVSSVGSDPNKAVKFQ